MLIKYLTFGGETLHTHGKNAACIDGVRRWDFYVQWNLNMVECISGIFVMSLSALQPHAAVHPLWEPAVNSDSWPNWKNGCGNDEEKIFFFFLEDSKIEPVSYKLKLLLSFNIHWRNLF